METIYREGDLIRFERFENKWTLCGSTRSEPPVLREFPVKEFEIYTAKGLAESFKSFEGKVGLIVSIHRNRLDQPLGYRVMVGDNTWFCKSVIADKYFSLVESKGDESR